MLVVDEYAQQSPFEGLEHNSRSAGLPFPRTVGFTSCRWRRNKRPDSDRDSMHFGKHQVVDRQISNSSSRPTLRTHRRVDRQDCAYELMKTEQVHRHRHSEQPLITKSAGISFRRRHDVILQIDRELRINRVIRRVRVTRCARLGRGFLSLGPTGFLWPRTSCKENKSRYQNNCVS